VQFVLNELGNSGSEKLSYSPEAGEICLAKIQLCMDDKRWLFLDGIYATDTAMCIVFTDWETGATGEMITSPAKYRQPRDLIGHTVRTVIGLAEQVGLLVPCFCMLYLNDNGLRSELEEQMGNQDWHRGDFALLVYEGSDINKKETHIAGVAGFLGHSSFGSDLRQITTDDFIDGLDSEMKRRRLSPDRCELLEETKSILKELDDKGIVDDPRAFGTKLDMWVKSRIDDIERRMTDDEAVGA
jgi:hypothetical protein